MDLTPQNRAEIAEVLREYREKRAKIVEEISELRRALAVRDARLVEIDESILELKQMVGVIRSAENGR